MSRLLSQGGHQPLGLLGCERVVFGHGGGVGPVGGDHQYMLAVGGHCPERHVRASCEGPVPPIILRGTASGESEECAIRVIIVRCKAKAPSVGLGEAESSSRRRNCNGDSIRTYNCSGVRAPFSQLDERSK